MVASARIERASLRAFAFCLAVIPGRSKRLDAVCKPLAAALRAAAWRCAAVVRLSIICNGVIAAGLAPIPAMAAMDFPATAED